MTETKHIQPQAISGNVRAPASKSDAQRAIAAAALAPGTSEIINFSPCADSLAALTVARNLGADVEHAGERITITGGVRPPGNELDCGESGLCLRMFAPIAALSSHEVRLLARGTLQQRPVGMVEEALRSFSVCCRSVDGLPPLTVHGPLRGGEAAIDGRASSQHLTGLLFALPLAAGPSRLVVHQAKSKPYLQMTLATLRRFGITIEADLALEHFEIRGGQRYRPCSYAIEGDWSGAAFLLVAAAIAGEVTVANLDINSPQADRAVVEVLNRCGAAVSAGPGRVGVKRGRLAAFEFDASDCPDLFPPLTALACFCRGKSVIFGADRLKHKESDRAQALVNEFLGLGAKIDQVGNRLEITGGALPGGRAFSHHDHRIAMALGVAALASRQGVTIEQPGCVAKSYPHFFDDLAGLGKAP